MSCPEPIFGARGRVARRWRVMGRAGPAASRPPVRRRNAVCTLPFIVNLSGRMANNVVTGTVSGRCTGSFTMRKP
jgi:hypothetical protein